MAKKQVAQSAWSEIEDVVVAPRPPVEVHSTRVAFDDPRVSVGARRIITPARNNAWVVGVTYARGPYLGAKGESLRIVDRIKVRGRRGSDNFVACWDDGSFEVAYAGTPPERIGASDLVARIKSDIPDG